MVRCFSFLTKNHYHGKLTNGVEIAASNKSVTLNLVELDKTWYDQYMIIRVAWNTDFASGSTDSGIFSVANDSDRGKVEAKVKQMIDDSSESNSGREKINWKSTASDDNNKSAPSSSSSSSPSSGGGGGGGLSKGAIAGIVVGVVLGLLLVLGFAAFFCIRRRRNNKNNTQGGFGDQSASNTYMVDKEATRANVTDSPHSPFSDENQSQIQQVPLNHLHNAHDVQQDEAARRPASPYQDRPTSIVGSTTAARVITGGSQTPSGPPANVSHLIEDGMTEDEIRRLEEEERQLDDEIERAGRRR